MPANLKRRSYPACGRLIVLESAAHVQRPGYDKNAVENYEGMVSINFPAMPDTIELVRQTDYMVMPSPAYPDGLHMYKGTNPLKIPIKFNLHAFDREYCPKGVLSLLQVASELHALTLPFGDDSIKITTGQPAEQGKEGEKTDSSVVKNSQGPAEITGQLNATSYNIYPPATCYLELIITDRSSPGIACIGYVSEVSVILHGPWMRGPDVSQNLPTKGEFSFTFVHHPGHGNTWNYGQYRYENRSERQAYAQTVKDRLYNTHHLLMQADFHGFADKMDASQPASVATTATGLTEAQNATVEAVNAHAKKVGILTGIKVATGGVF